METAFYFYTIIIMLVCIAAGTISLSAYFVSRKRSYLYIVTFFLFYFLDLALIFQYEYLGQNVDYPLEFFYAIDTPALKILFALGTVESIWLIVCEYLDEHRLSLRVAPALVFIAISFSVVLFMPEGSLRQWLFYTMRQIFLLWCIAFSLVRYFRTKNEIAKTRLRRQKPFLVAVTILAFCIVVEDTFMILVWQPNLAIAQTLFPQYISERNFSENFLMLAFAYVSLREAAETLRLRFKEPPTSENPTMRQHIDELLPAFCERHTLTTREREIIALVLMGKDNQNIASELQLALGTVKAHVHNILKKTNTSDRQKLTQEFWRE